jgi:phosphodiesterase/alkaline phosphatase D-like protein
MRWLKGALNASRARWKLVANQVMITSLDAVPRNPLNTAVTSPGIADREAHSEAERTAAAAPLDAAVRANNPQIVYSNQAYKGYGLVEVGNDLRVQYRAVRDVRQPTSDVFTLRTFRVEAGMPQVIDESAPLPALPVR